MYSFVKWYKLFNGVDIYFFFRKKKEIVFKFVAIVPIKCSYRKTELERDGTRNKRYWSKSDYFGASESEKQKL